MISMKSSAASVLRASCSQMTPVSITRRVRLPGVVTDSRSVLRRAVPHASAGDAELEPGRSGAAVVRAAGGFHPDAGAVTSGTGCGGSRAAS